MPNIIITSILASMILFLVVATYVDYRKKRPLRNYPFISILIPAYNAEPFIERTIRNIYRSYSKKKFELIVINDCSKDGTLKRLKELRASYDFRIIDNKVNRGKAASINSVFQSAKSNLVFIIDADIIVNRKAIEDVVKRFQNDKEVGGVACSAKIVNYGIIPCMQDLEYNMQAITLSSYTIVSAVSLWGGCIAVRKEAFIRSGMLARNAVGEDTDLALKLNEGGWKVEQSVVYVYTYAPTDIKTWYKQRMRWTASYTQCFIRHFKTYIKNPITTIFLLFYMTLTAVLAYSMFNNHLFLPDIYNFLSYINLNGVGVRPLLNYFNAKVSHVGFGQGFTIGIVYSLFSLPYALMSIKKPNHILKILLIFPYALIYYPIWMFVSFLGVIYGIFKYVKLRNGGRAW